MEIERPFELEVLWRVVDPADLNEETLLCISGALYALSESLDGNLARAIHTFFRELADTARRIMPSSGLPVEVGAELEEMDRRELFGPMCSVASFLAGHVLEGRHFNDQDINMLESIADLFGEGLVEEINRVKILGDFARQKFLDWMDAPRMKLSRYEGLSLEDMIDLLEIAVNFVREPIQREWARFKDPRLFRWFMVDEGPPSMHRFQREGIEVWALVAILVLRPLGGRSERTVMVYLIPEGHGDDGRMKATTLFAGIAVKHGLQHSGFVTANYKGETVRSSIAKIDELPAGIERIEE